MYQHLKNGYSEKANVSWGENDFNMGCIALGKFFKVYCIL